MSFLGGAVFTVIGAVYLTFLLGWAGQAVWVQAAYRPVEARVLQRHWSEEHRRVKGPPFYRVEALLAYTVDGQDFQAWVEWPKETREKTGPRAAEVLDQVHVGQETTCYSSFLHPQKALQDRGRLDLWFLVTLPLPLLFLLGGIRVMAASWSRTFPRGLPTEAGELLRRLPPRFYRDAAGALLCAAVAVGAFVTLGPDLLGWSCLLLPAGVLGFLWLAVRAVRSGTVALPSPEKRATGRPAERTSPESTLPGTDRGKWLAVRLRGSLLQCDTLLVIPACCFFGMILLMMLVARAGRDGQIATGLRWAVNLGLLAAAGGTVVLTLRTMRWLRRLVVEVPSHPLRAGERSEVAVHHPDDVALAAVCLKLLCVEQAGTGKSERRATVSEQSIPLDSPAGPGVPRRGWLQLPGGPASFALGDYRVCWRLEAKLGRWLRWKVCWPVEVRPTPRAEQPVAGRAAPGRMRLDDEVVTLWIDGDRPAFAARATLSGGFSVRPREAAGKLRTVELSVLSSTGAGESAALDVCHYEEHGAAGGDRPLCAARQFHTVLPEGPLSYSGQVFQVRWAVRLRLRYAEGDEVVRELPFLLLPASGVEVPAG
jgi:hypothetical protein